MNRHNIICIDRGNARLQAHRLRKPVTLTIRDEATAIVGTNGAGKTKLVQLLTGAHPLAEGQPVYDFSPASSPKACDNIKYIAFCDTSGEGGTSAYYQQRWNRGDCDDQLPTVADFLQGNGAPASPQVQALYEALGIPSLLDKQIIMLSSGELRRMQLAKAMRSLPRVLIIDNPYIGLDQEVRRQITDLLKELAQRRIVVPVIVVSRMEDVPDFIVTIIRMDGEEILSTGPGSEADSVTSSGSFSKEETEAIRSFASQSPFVSNEIVRFNNISIRYGNQTIIDNFSWRIANNEKWALSGRNGVGKSTLLSLVCADNPQAYACDIALFGMPRGSGESIWDIKKHIGYVSPEMYRSYRKDIPTMHIIASGLRDTIGLYVRPTESEIARCELWARIFGLDKYRNTSYLNLSSGEQRLALLARAFVKNPSLLILDEPFHGLDTYNRNRAKQIIDTFCSVENKTLIMVSHYENEYPDCITHKLTLSKHPSL